MICVARRGTEEEIPVSDLLWMLLDSGGVLDQFCQWSDEPNWLIVGPVPRQLQKESLIIVRDWFFERRDTLMMGMCGISLSK